MLKFLRLLLHFRDFPLRILGVFYKLVLMGNGSDTNFHLKMYQPEKLIYILVQLIKTDFSAKQIKSTVIKRNRNLANAY